MAGYQTREFKKTLTLTYDQAKKIKQAQKDMYDSGIVNPNTNRLTTLLSAAGSILGLVFVSSTPASVAAGVVSLSAGLVGNERAILDKMVKNGNWYLDDVIALFERNPHYKMVEIEFPFIEYKRHGKLLAQFITGQGRLIRINTGSGWLIM
ncbi:hypothetical protein [Paenibacillus faecalis]|uniref:hypothetical protein n=1 Tax=Paenibacillus faecalis TaxID=2079532 RepID=UPI000D106FD9|nr:hypothetical protein [Paenibacillus faecalis]